MGRADKLHEAYQMNLIAAQAALALQQAKLKCSACGECSPVEAYGGWVCANMSQYAVSK